MKSRLAGIGTEPGGQTPAQFAKFIAAETAKWTRVAKDSGATIE